MKNALIIFLLSFLGFTISAEAQILKKLKEKMLKKTEDTTTSDQSQQMWGNRENSAMFPMGGKRVPAEEIPASYDFNWEYQLKLTTDQGSILMDYYLKEGASYFGIKMAQAGEMFIVYDRANNLNLMFMESSGQKMLSASRLPDPDMSSQEDVEEMQIKEIGNKTILGYTCRGYQAESPEYLMTFYITTEPGISFSRFFEGDSKKIPDNLKSIWNREKNGIMMEMDFKEKKNPANSGHMICTSLKRKSLKLNKSDYQAF